MIGQVSISIGKLGASPFGDSSPGGIFSALLLEGDMADDAADGLILEGDMAPGVLLLEGDIA